MSRIIINDHIYLDCIQESDAERLAHIANDPMMHKNVGDGMPYPYTLESARWRINNCQYTNDHNKKYNLGIYIDGQYAGNCGWERKDEVNGLRFRHNIHFGYWIGKEYHGQGFGTQIVQGLSDYILQYVPNCHRLYAKVFGRNPTSRHVLEKCGFELEGTLREAILREGKRYDERVLSKINSKQNQNISNL